MSRPRVHLIIHDQKDGNRKFTQRYRRESRVGEEGSRNTIQSALVPTSPATAAAALTVFGSRQRHIHELRGFCGATG